MQSISLTVVVGARYGETDSGTVLGLAKKTLDGHRSGPAAERRIFNRRHARVRGAPRGTPVRGSTLADVLGELVPATVRPTYNLRPESGKLVNLAWAASWNVGQARLTPLVRRH